MPERQTEPELDRLAVANRFHGSTKSTESTKSTKSTKSTAAFSGLARNLHLLKTSHNPTKIAPIPARLTGPSLLPSNK